MFQGLLLNEGPHAHPPGSALVGSGFQRECREHPRTAHKQGKAHWTSAGAMRAVRSEETLSSTLSQLKSFLTP